MNIAKLDHLFIKSSSGRPMEKQLMMKLQKGYGIIGDKNASGISPRQVLVTRSEDLQYVQIKPGDLRENIVLNGLDEKFFQPGSVIRIGKEVSIRLTFFCEPCKRIAHLVKISEIMKRRGILAVILTGGTIKKGDEVTIEKEVFEPLPEVPYQRFLEFIGNIPASKVITYRDVTIGMGVAESYMRTVPAYIKKTDSTKYPLHRIVDTEGNLLSGYVKNQDKKLKAEGVSLSTANDLFGGNKAVKVNLQMYQWKDGELYISN